MTALALFGSIPSPSGNAINIGPLELRAYGLAIAVGVIVAVTVAQRRWARGGNPDDVSRLATWSVVGGLTGARAYHVITDYHRFQGRWFDVLKVWEGGLGIPGGLLAGVLTGVFLARRHGLPAAQLLDVHPTFLYEALWNLALAGLLVLYERRRPDARLSRSCATGSTRTSGPPSRRCRWSSGACAPRQLRLATGRRRSNVRAGSLRARGGTPRDQLHELGGGIERCCVTATVYSLDSRRGDRGRE